MTEKTSARSLVTRAGFIGLGQQGMPIARNLLSEGNHLVVFDSNDAPLKEAESLGATIAGSPAEVADLANQIFICVATPEQTCEVVEGSNGLLQHLTPGTIIVVHSTIGPSAILRLAEVVMRAGAELVDAALSGGAAGAKAKSLLFMVGASPSALAACLPLLQVSARQIIHAGGVGAGSRAKLVQQLMLCGNLLIAKEGWELGLEAGLSRETVADVIRSGGGQSAAAEMLPALEWTDHITKLWRKDLGLITDMAAGLNVATPLTLAVQDLMSASIGTRNISGITYDRED